MKKPTPSDIRKSQILGTHFFSRNTLRFFGQTMRSFKTAWYDKEKGIVKLYAPSKLAGFNTVRFIDVSDASNWKKVRV